MSITPARTLCSIVVQAPNACAAFAMYGNRTVLFGSAERYATIRRMLICMLLIVSCVILMGCQTCGSRTDAALADAPSVEELLADHNRRASRLQQLDAAGVLEIEWYDDRNRRRREQGDVEVWIDQPWRTALRVSKLGEDLLWLGSNEQRYWLFDLLDKDRRVLTTHHHGIALMWGSGDDALQLQPLALLDLMGITQVQTMQDAEIDIDSARRNWVVVAQGLGGVLRMHFDIPTRQLTGVALLDDERQPAVTSRLSRYEPVDVLDDIAFERPQVATLVDITEPAGRAKFKLALSGQMFGDLADQPVDSLFQLQPLRDRYRPHVVQDETTIDE